MQFQLETWYAVHAEVPKHRQVQMTCVLLQADVCLRGTLHEGR